MSAIKLLCVQCFYDFLSVSTDPPKMQYLRYVKYSHKNKLSDVSLNSMWFKYIIPDY